MANEPQSGDRFDGNSERDRVDEFLDPLEPTEKLFAEAFAWHLNYADAWRTAFEIPMDKWADKDGVRGYHFGGKPRVKAAVDAIVEDRKQRLQADGDLVIHELACIAYSDLTQYLDDDGDLDVKKIKQASVQVRRAIAGVTVKRDKLGCITGVEAKQWDKVRALELLGKVNKLFIDKLEVDDKTGPKQVSVTFVNPGCSDPDCKCSGHQPKST